MSYQEDNLNGSTDEEDGEKEYSKVDENVCTLYADDLPEEVDCKHAVDAENSKEQSERHPSPQHKRVKLHKKSSTGDYRLSVPTPTYIMEGYRGQDEVEGYRGQSKVGTRWIEGMVSDRKSR